MKLRFLIVGLLAITFSFLVWGVGYLMGIDTVPVLKVNAIPMYHQFPRITIVNGEMATIADTFDWDKGVPKVKPATEPWEKDLLKEIQHPKEAGVEIVPVKRNKKRKLKDKDVDLYVYSGEYKCRCECDEYRLVPLDTHVLTSVE